MKNGFVAQFIPTAVGLHVVLVEYNGVAVGGTPYYAKVISKALKDKWCDGIRYSLKVSGVTAPLLNQDQ